MNVFGKKKVYADEQNERYIARGKEEERGEVEKQERRRGRKQRSQELQELLGQQEAAAAAPAQQDNALETTSVSQTLLHSPSFSSFIYTSNAKKYTETNFKEI